MSSTKHDCEIPGTGGSRRATALRDELGLKTLNGVLVVVSLAGLPQVLWSSFSGDSLRFVYWALYLALVVATLNRSFGFTPRALLLLFALFSVAAAEIILRGPAGASRLYFLGCILFSGIFFGLSGGLMALSLSIATVALAYGLIFSGMVELLPAEQAIMDYTGDLIHYPLSLVVISSALLVSLTYIFKELERTIQSRETMVDALQTEVTEKENAQEEVRLSEARYRLLADNAKDIVWTADMNLNFTYCSPSVLEFRGFTVEEAMNQTLEESVSEASLPVLMKSLQEEIELEAAGTAEPGRSRTLEYQVTCKDGTLKWAESVITFLRDEDGTVQQILGVARDISKRKYAEEEKAALESRLLQTQKLEGIGVLAGGIAHDFNNLLLSILGNADLALNQMSPTATGRDNLQAIVKGVQRASDLCMQLLAYSGKGKFVVEAINLTELVEDMAHLLEVSASKKAILKYDFAHGLPSIEADVSQTRQVIMNLITNASEAIGDETGVVTIRTGVMHCDEAYLAATYLNDPVPPGSYVYVEIKDTGVGMDEATQAKIFDPFFTSKFAGRGLGLAAVLGIVRGHNGAIRLESIVGRGTSFRVLFPASDKPAAAIQSDEPVGHNGAVSGTVLVVDDEEMVRSLAQTILEDAGYTVITANDGAEGLDTFTRRAEEIDLVLLDLTMPKLNGREALDQMRRIKRGVRVILSSGYTEEAAVGSLDADGVAGFIQKPYRAAKLLQVVGDKIKAP